MGLADDPRPANAPTAFARGAVWLPVEDTDLNFAREAVDFQSVIRGGVQSSTVFAVFCL